MKKVIILIGLALLLAGCDKEEIREIEINNVTFYSYDTGPWNVYVDGKLITSIKAITQPTEMYGKPECGDSRYFTMTLKEGQHTYSLKLIPGYGQHIETRPIYFTVEARCNLVKIEQ